MISLACAIVLALLSGETAHARDAAKRCGHMMARQLRMAIGTEMGVSIPSGCVTARLNPFQWDIQRTEYGYLVMHIPTARSAALVRQPAARPDGTVHVVGQRRELWEKGGVVGWLEIVE